MLSNIRRKKKSFKNNTTKKMPKDLETNMGICVPSTERKAFHKSWTLLDKLEYNFLER